MRQMLKIFIPFYLLLGYTTCYSQDIKMNKEVEEIIQLGKDSILQLALTSIDERASIQNLAKVKIVTNGKDVFVSLRNPIKYLPTKSVFYFDVMISIIEKSANYNPVSNGIVYDEKDTIPFYKQTQGIK